MSDDYSDVPPWEPIADWLHRITREEGTISTNPTRKEIRDQYELRAKAIAYEIATYGADGDSE